MAANEVAKPRPLQPRKLKVRTTDVEPVIPIPKQVETKVVMDEAGKKDPTKPPPVVIDLDNSVMEEEPLAMKCILVQN